MNITLFNFLHSFAFKYQWLDGVIWFFAVPFIYIMVVTVGLYLLIKCDFFKTKDIKYFVRQNWKNIATIFLSAILAYAVADILKIIIHTSRPALVLSNIHTLFFESGYAFPSGHSATISALAFSVFFKYRRFGYVCLVAALLIGISRVVAGVHFPIDIIGGYIVGFLVAFFIKRL